MNRKFTLIELLIVVAIIGILVSIMIPSLAKAREKGKRAVCKSNLSQAYKTIYMYGNNYKGRISTGMSWATYQGSYFVSGIGSTDPSGTIYYAYYMEGLMDEAPQLWYCPSERLSLIHI